MLEVKTLLYFYVKPRDPNFSRLVTLSVQTTDRQHIMTVAGTLQ